MIHFFINIDKWNALPKSYQAIDAPPRRPTPSWMLASYDALNPAALRRLVAGGAQLRPFRQEVLEACFKAANEVYAEIGAKNADFKKIWDNMKAFRGEDYLWSQVAEGTYDTFMMVQQRAGAL